MNGWIGRTLGKVQIESLIARGGVAEIYLGTHATLQRRVAVKILRTQYEDDPDLLERFQREAVVVSRLRHPNIVQIYDFDSIEGHPYIVMEHIPGPSLSRYLDAFHAKDKRLDMPAVSHLLTSVASALEYAHKRGVIHRDVKPGNILLTSHTAQVIAGITMPAGFEPILTDFGLVRFLNSSRHTTAGQIAGTPAYMSPEQARGEATDERTDIYSLGIVLYEMLSGGRVPFEGETTMSVLLKHIHEPVTPLLGLAPAIQAVLDRALAKDRGDRYQTPTQFSADFQNAIQNPNKSDTIVDEIPVSSPPSGIEVKPRRKLWPALTAAATLIIAVGSYLWLSSPVSDQNAEIIPNTGGTSLPTASPIQAAPVQLRSTTILRFRSGSKIADQAEVIAQAMPLPPVGMHYVVWLLNNESRQRLGVLSLDDEGKGNLIFTDPKGTNLVGEYDRVEISVEAASDSVPDEPSLIVYAFSMPIEGLDHVRNLLASSSSTPGGSPIMPGLISNIEMIQQFSREMDTDYKNGDITGMKQKASIILNLVTGDQSPVYKKLDENGDLLDPSDGFGLLPNGGNAGYIQAAYSEADYASNTPGATLNMINNGGRVKVCAQDLAVWAPQLRENILAISTSTTGTNLDRPVADSLKIADQLMNGIDLDGNQTVESIAGECGAALALENAYYMADMPLLPVSLELTPTITVTPPGASPTVTRAPSTITPAKGSPGSGSQNTPAPPAATKPGNRQNDKPKPTKKNSP